MCKIMVMAGVNNENRKLAWEFARNMAVQMTPGNSDGLGYAAVTSDGELFGERWHINSEAFNVRQAQPNPTKEEILLMHKYDGFLLSDRPPAKYNKFGSINEDAMSAIVLHTRMATSGKQFMNTHPFVDNGTALIHNGVIRNAFDLPIKQSTCDSEAILNLYNRHNVTNKPENIQSVANKLQGYYACGVITETKKYGYVVDIFKDSSARLSAAYISDMKIMVFSTVLDDIVAVCAKMGMEIAYKYSVKEGVLIRLSRLTGDPLVSQKFNATFKEEKKKTKTETIDDDGWSFASGYRGDYIESRDTSTLKFPRSWKGESKG
jgi:predicted glutamine amidotransferase